MRGRHSRAVLEVLDAERHTREEAGILSPRDGGVDRVSGVARLRLVEVDEGVERAVAGVDRGERPVEDPRRTQLAPADGVGDLDSTQWFMGRRHHGRP